MAIVWIDIWDVQSGSNAKMLINRCFNVGKYIVTIQEANMNLGIPQCKNCWKWGHVTFLCRIQGAKCIKYNSPYKSENHHKFGWCCKVNKKTNPPRLEIKKGKPYPHAPIVRGTIKLTPINVSSGGTASIESGSKRSMLRSMKTGSNQFALWKVTRNNYDPMKPQDIFSKCLQE